MSEIKYLTELTELLRDLLYESWMDEDDYREVEQETLKQLNISYVTLSDELQKGVDNGYGIEFQFDLIRNKIKA